MGSLARVDVLHASFPGRRWSELRLSLDAPISSIKETLYKHTGTVGASMSLALLLPSADGGPQTPIALNEADEFSLRMFGCQPAGCTLLITDVSAGGAADVAAAAAADADGDVSRRYVMPDEVYERRPFTVRRFLANLQASRPDLFIRQQQQQQEQQQEQQQQQQQQQQQTEEEIRRSFAIGARCQLSGDRRGQVAYVGPRPSRPQEEIWIGVALDEPLGRTDGRDFRLCADKPPTTAAKTTTAAGRAVGGRRQVYSGGPLFDCQGEAYGEFALPCEVKVGDFPPLDPFDLLDEI